MLRRIDARIRLQLTVSVVASPLSRPCGTVLVAEAACCIEGIRAAFAWRHGCLGRLGHELLIDALLVDQGVAGLHVKVVELLVDMSIEWHRQVLRWIGTRRHG